MFATMSNDDESERMVGNSGLVDLNVGEWVHLLYRAGTGHSQRDVWGKR